MRHPADGILLIDKGDGEVSHGVVKRVRAALCEGRGFKVGHAGTLDPFATGLLIILLGQGTKLSNFIMAGEKVYSATIELGVETDTLDPTGHVVRTGVVPDLSLEDVREKANRFVGEIQQVPPVYSAVKHKGVRAYKLARRGLEVDLQERLISVYSLCVLSVDLPYITMRIRCSSGTYVRSIAADLGRELGPGAHLKSLRRLRSGPFEVEKALSSGKVTPDCRERLFKRVIPLTEALPHMCEVCVSEVLAKKVRQGYQPVAEELFSVSGPNGLGRDASHIVGPSFPGSPAAAKGNTCKSGVDHVESSCLFKIVNDNGLVAIARVNLREGADCEKVKIMRVFV